MNKTITKLVLLLVGALAAPAALATDCDKWFTKEVSVNGGATWFDANTVEQAPTAELGTPVEYRFIVENCKRWKFVNSKIDDPTLGIDSADVPDGVWNIIKYPERVTITHAESTFVDRYGNVSTQPIPVDSPFRNLLQPQRCDTSGDKLNTATATTNWGTNSLGYEEIIQSDKAWVRCEGDGPLPASLGDRVWEDLNRDGVQDCTDSNENGILGDAGDSGTECDAGIPSVAVDLYGGEGCLVALDSTVTDANGFYSFGNLDAGDYCVKVTSPGPEFCEVGTPQFTAKDNGDDASDSDADANGLTAATTLNAGETDLTIDAGIYCPAPLPASLGDRVWEDLDRDGVQDCEDSNENGIFGDAGDSGPECDAGIQGVPVRLLEGDCSTPVDSTTTDVNGFYRFDGLVAGNYCVDFDLPPYSFCNTDSFMLGAPAFTAQDTGNDASDSDADATSGLTDPIGLGSGATDLTIDAGVFCPAKIGDFVFEDLDGDGINDPNEPGVPGVETTLFECGPDGVAGTNDDVNTGETRVTDLTGMYMYGGEPEVFDLAPGEYYVKFNPATLPEGFGFTTPDVGEDDAIDSDCMPDTGMTACTDLTVSRAIDLTRDCGVVPPPSAECDLRLDKFCSVVPAPAADFEKCSGKLEEFTLLWAGTGTITAAGPNNTVTVSNGHEATFVGPFSDNNVYVEISGDVTGTSVFHVSCSDEDFNDPTDCGKMAGDGKDNDAGMINDWKLEGFVDADGTVLDCTPDGGEEFADNCTFEQPAPATCDTGDKPEELTWRYDGGTGGDGDCADSTFYTITDADGKLHEDFVCEGSTINTADTITVTDDGGNSYIVVPGASFTTRREDIGAMTLTDASGGSQDLVFHTSCSQPLEAMATAGALTLTALDGRTGGQDVIYRYDVTNLGDELTNVTVDDDQLGIVLSGLTMENGDFTSVDVVATLFGTTVNTAQASGTLSDGGACAPATAFDTVTVEMVIPACSIGVELYKVEDDKLKIKLTNNDTLDRTLTLDTLTVSYPAARGLIEKVKLNGDAYQYNDSAEPITDNPAIIGSDDWTATDVSKRQIKAGETKTLEIETFDKGTKDDYFEVTVDFGDGCVETIIVDDQAIVIFN